MAALTTEVIEALLPGDEPRFRLPRFGFEDINQRLQNLKTWSERRILLWSLAAQAVAEGDRLGLSVPGFEGATYGFVPVGEAAELPRGVRSVGGYVFGTAFAVESREDLPGQEILPLPVADISFACVINRRRTTLHVSNVASPVGTGACWARSGKSRITPAADGVVTAGHVVGHLALGSAVMMDDGNYWNVGDRGSCKIDAALVVRAGCIPAGVMPLRLQYNPIGGTDVSFTGVGTGTTVTARITHTVVHPTYFSDRHPMRVFMDNYGSSGDSGALVIETSTGTGVGLYMGCEPIPVSAGASVTVQEGVCQFLAQAQYVLQASLFL